jgi:diguanylate cyclase (GGDEF)-like protein
MRANNATISEGAKLRQKFERDAMVDGLTALHNRRWMNEKLPRIVQRSHRSGDSLSVLMLDVDHFKRFNDSYGHAAGDEVLRVVGRVLMACLRPTDLGARYGGEEFLVILPETGVNGARAAAERLRDAVQVVSIQASDGRMLPPVTISVGIAELAGGQSDAQLIEQADAALYRAKNKGRNRVES